MGPRGTVSYLLAESISQVGLAHSRLQEDQLDLPRDPSFRLMALMLLACYHNDDGLIDDHDLLPWRGKGFKKRK